MAVAALAAEPSAAPVGLLAGGDPRSDGGGPGLVGSPLAMLLGGRRHWASRPPS